MIPDIGLISFRALVENGGCQFGVGQRLYFKCVWSARGSGIQEAGEIQREIVTMVRLAQSGRIAVRPSVLEVQDFDHSYLRIFVLQFIIDGCRCFPALWRKLFDALPQRFPVRAVGLGDHPGRHVSRNYLEFKFAVLIVLIEVILVPGGRFLGRIDTYGFAPFHCFPGRIYHLDGDLIPFIVSAGAVHWENYLEAAVFVRLYASGELFRAIFLYCVPDVGSYKGMAGIGIDVAPGAYLAQRTFER